MTLAYPVDVAVDPNDKSKRYVLFGNGRIDAYGGALPITDGPSWYDRIDQPVAKSLHVTNWATPAGYVFDFAGGFQPFGGAPVITTQSGDTFVNSNGLPYTGYRWYHKAFFKPGSGQGYALTQYGGWVAFGGAAAPPRVGPRWTEPAVKGAAVRWESDGTVKAFTADRSGGLWADFTAVLPSSLPRYFAGVDVVRDLAMSDWATSSGYLLTADGATHAFGVAANPLYGGPYRVGADVARTLFVLSAVNPTRLWQVHAGGQSFEYVASTPPSVVAGGDIAISPTATVTGTTRPVLSWAYVDPQSDSQAAYEVYAFTQAFVTAHSMTDPAVWAADAVVAESGINPSTRGVTPTVDLVNGQYRMYVRAKDTADQWSAWDDHAWTQNVPVLAAPTGLTATANPATLTVALSVTATAGAFVRFEASDDGGITWAAVVGLEKLTRVATTVGTDVTIPFGVARKYRAVAYSVAPRTASAPSGVATATINAGVYALTVPGVPALGGKISVHDPDQWTRTVKAGVFEGVGAVYPIVVSDGVPKARRGDLGLITETRAEWQTIRDLATSDAVLLYRDPFGESMYCRIVGDWSRLHLPAAPAPSETTPLRHMHRVTLPLVEVAPPVLEV